MIRVVYLSSIKYHLYMNKATYQQMQTLIDFIVERKLYDLSLDEVADCSGMSPAHIQKLFTQWVGVSPKQFSRYLSLQYAKALLEEGKTLEQTALNTGLSGTGRLHDLFVDIVAMTPGEYKQQGSGLGIAYSFFDTLFGPCLIANTNKGVCAILFGENQEALVEDLYARYPKGVIHDEVTDAQQQVASYLQGLDTHAKIKLHLQGSNFQLQVWEALLSIPEGAIASYGSIAHSLGQPKISRAVGKAVGENPIGYIIPCHRVLKATGEISGYRWGVSRKRMMLGYEAVRRHERDV